MAQSPLPQPWPTQNGRVPWRVLSVGAGPGPAGLGRYKPAENRENASVWVRAPQPPPTCSGNPAASPRSPAGMTSPKGTHVQHHPSAARVSGHGGPPGVSGSATRTVTHVRTGSGRGGEKQMTGSGRKATPGMRWAANGRVVAPERGLDAARTRGPDYERARGNKNATGGLEIQGKETVQEDANTRVGGKWS